jgi:hypothetical protein
MLGKRSFDLDFSEAVIARYLLRKLSRLADFLILSIFKFKEVFLL